MIQGMRIPGLPTPLANVATGFSKSLYVPVLDAVKRAPFSARLAEAKRNERLSPHELRMLADTAVRNVVLLATDEVPYYAQLFREHGIDPSSIRCTDDLRRIPTLSKADLFVRKAALLAPRFEGRRFRGSTSGSTGIAMEFFQDSEQYAWCDAVQCRGRAWWGVERGDPTVVLWSRPAANTRLSSSAAWAKNRLRNAVQFDTFKELDTREIDRILHAIERHRPTCIYGYGSSLGRLALELDQRGLRLATNQRPRMVEYTADHMFAEERAAAEHVFGVPVASAYGSSECGGVAQQCREGRLHISVDHVVVEILREDGSAADPGEPGEIVLTQLHNRAMPLIRFRVGDIGSTSGAPCPCGHPFPTMELGVGKTVDLITTSSKRNVSAHLLDYVNLHLMKLGVRGVRQFLVEQTALDAFVLTVVKDTVFDPRSVELFVDKMKEYLGATIVVETRFTEGIALEPTGKRRYFKKAAGLGAERGREE